MNGSRICVSIAALAMTFVSLGNAQDYKPINVNLDADAARLEEALRMPIAIKFVEKPLSDVMNELATSSGLSIFFDTNALLESGIATDAPVSVSLAPVRVEAALNLILESVNLSWMPKHDGIMITTEDVVNDRLITRVYPVYDLVVIKAGGKSTIDYDSLMETITSTIETDTWEENGGNGSMEPFNGSLVVSQSWQVHRILEKTLSALRNAHEQAPSDWNAAIADEFRAQQGTVAGRRVYASPLQSNVIRTMFNGQAPNTNRRYEGGGLF